MEEDNHSSADEFEHVENETGMDSQVVEQSDNGIEILRGEFRSEMDALKAENKMLAARLEILEQQSKVTEVEANQAKQEISDKKSEKQFNDMEQEEQRTLIGEKMADKEKEKKSEAELEQMAEHMDKQGIVDFEGKMAALEKEVLTAMELYLGQPRTMQAVFKKISGIYSDGTNMHCHSEALDLVLRALEMHLVDHEVQIVGIDSMLTLKGKVKINQDIKERVIQALMDAMEKHQDSLRLVKKCCSGLFDQFNIPQDVLFAYGRLAKLLLKVFETHESYADVVISKLYSMSCHMESNQRNEMGETGAIETMLQQISRKIQANTCGYVMEDCWVFLWKVIKATPVNCERFLKASGLTLFSECYDKFGGRNSELVRMMMGTIWKISEMPQFRNQLITNGLLEIFCALLNGEILVSYISAGILSNLVSDNVWINSGVALPRDHVNKLIFQATQKWDLQDDLYIIYASFKHIFPLLSHWHAIGSQYWAVWTLANMMKRDKKKYCRIVIEEGGMMLLEELKTDSRSNDEIRQLASTVIKNVEDWKKSSQVANTGNK